ncbi:alpha/beta fold hydrolase [Actinocrispum sp. NPDC049592]|uniref:alpha/beta fold hydrolase n=1 Tax=Actinocrispum sp. NPDC049592 TaxID=3154835 RepID=UPI00344399E6
MYDDKGAGQPILLIHGHPFDRTMWRPQLDHFSQTHRVITPDLRGYGEHKTTATKTPLSTHAKDLNDLLHELEIDTAIVGGLSMGGQIAMEFYRTYPHRVKALMLADTFPDGETEEGHRARNAMADRLLREGMASYAEEVIWKMVAPYNKHAADHVMAMMKNTDPTGAAAGLRGRAERPDYVETLKTISIPTLVVVGRDDEYTPVGVAERMRDLIPGATLEVIEGAAHLPNLERQTEFDRAFQRFLNTVG